MPMKSTAQRGYLWANKPDIAREFESMTPKGKKLPKKVKKKKKAMKKSAAYELGKKAAGVKR